MTLRKIFILTLFMAIFYACNNDLKDSLVNQTDNTTIRIPSEYELKIKKLKVIADCFNGYSNSAFTAYQEYIGSFGNDVSQYKSKEVTDFTEVHAFDVQKLKSLNDILKIPVLDELNPLITSYRINARAFSVALNSCQRYYSKKGFKEDNFEQGNGMHKPVIEIFARFSVADSLLRVRSNKISKNLELEYLSKLKKDGSNVAYLSIIGKNEAKKLNTLLTTSIYKDLRAEQLVVSHNKIKNTYNKLDSLKSDNANGFNPKDIAYFKVFEQFYWAFDELYLRKKEKRKFSKKELKALERNKTASYIEGSIEKVIFNYKELLKS